jgi:hypothetical protein
MDLLVGYVVATRLITGSAYMSDKIGKYVHINSERIVNSFSEINSFQLYNFYIV